MELQCYAPITRDAEHRSTDNSTIDCHWQNWEVFFPHFFIKINVLTYHSYIRERHHQIEDNFETLFLFGNTFFVFGKISIGKSREGWGGLGGSSGAT